ncbi:MAG: ribonuclease Z [Nitrospirae bacterium]|nr:ribonuclease Z [Nitrospirota bacterium]
MKPLIHSYLINSPFGDPGLYIEIMWEKRAILFDLGDNTSLEPSKLLKVSDVFISHTHMDHFAGFDHLLRLLLKREKGLRMFGPPGIIDNVEGKLKGYTWNLVDGYAFILHVTEVYPDKINMAEFRANEGFKRHNLGSLPFSGTLLEEDMLTISACHLDHKVPSLGFSIRERFHININKDKLDAIGLPIGPWLKEFKEALWQGQREEDDFSILLDNHPVNFPLGELKNRIAVITEGQKISYIVDSKYTAENVDKIVRLAEGSDVMYCESAYLHEDVDLASERFHLTAKQTGSLARAAKAKRLVILHFSPRYKDNPSLLYKEAMEELNQKIPPLTPP